MNPGGTEQKRRSSGAWAGIAGAAVLAALLMAVLASKVIRVPGDDLSLQEAMTRSGFLEHIRYCYRTYSGRVTAKALEYASAVSTVALWRALEAVCAAVMAASLAGFLLEFRRRETGDMTAGLTAAEAVFCAVSPFLMYYRTFHEASLWISGTTNYSFIAVPALPGALLYYRHFRNGKSRLWEKAAALALLFFSLCGSEQTGAVILVFLLIAAAVRLARREKDPFTFLAAALALVLYAACFVFCPGTKGRFDLEMAARVPDFLTMPFARHAQIAGRWTAWSLTKGLGFLPGLLWLTEALLLLIPEKGKPGAGRIIAGLLLGAGAAVHFLAFVFPVLEEFMVGWDRTDYTPLSSRMIAFFGVMTAAAAAVLPAVLAEKREKVTAVLTLLAAYATVLMMVVSPVMIDSGERTKFAGSLVVTVLLGRLMVRLETVCGKRKLRAVTIGMTLLTAACAAACWLVIWKGIRGGFVQSLR